MDCRFPPWAVGENLLHCGALQRLQGSPLQHLWHLVPLLQPVFTGLFVALFPHCCTLKWVFLKTLPRCLTLSCVLLVQGMSQLHPVGPAAPTRLRNSGAEWCYSLSVGTFALIVMRREKKDHVTSVYGSERPTIVRSGVG